MTSSSLSLSSFSIYSVGFGRIVGVVVVGVGICVVCVVRHGIDHHHHRFVVDRQLFFHRLQ